MSLEQDGMYKPTLSFQEVDSLAERIHPPYKQVGIMGGMGPAATVDLFKGIVDQSSRHIRVEKDQDHLEIYVANIPQVPDRTPFVLYDLGLEPDPAEDPYPYLVRGANKLAASGAEFIGIPCNTAHYFVPALQAHIEHKGFSMSVVSMIEETADAIAKQHTSGDKVGLLATTGTLRSRLYHAALESRGFVVVEPTPEEQKDVMEGIYGKETGNGVKKGKIEQPREWFRTAAESLRAQGAVVVATACTEIPIALRKEDTSVPLINPTEVLGDALIEYATGKRAT